MAIITSINMHLDADITIFAVKLPLSLNSSGQF